MSKDRKDSMGTSAYATVIRLPAICPPRPPSSSIVQRYLEHGEHREEIEALAAVSAPFARVLAALRRDHEERVARGERRRKQRGRRARRQVQQTGKIERPGIERESRRCQTAKAWR